MYLTTFGISVLKYMGLILGLIKVKWDLSTDIDMLLMVEKGIRDKL